MRNRLARTLHDDAGDEAFSHAVEFARRKVIEKKQRLRALHDDVVDAHSDKVDANRVVAGGVDGGRSADPVSSDTSTGLRYRSNGTSNSAPKPPSPPSTSRRVERFT